MELDDYRIKPIFITKHRMSRGLGGTNAVQYFADWDEVSVKTWNCLLYTSPSPRDQRGYRMPSSA